MIGLVAAAIGAVMMTVATVWLFGAWGLAAAGVCWVVVGLLVDFERLVVTHAEPAATPLRD